MTPIDITGYLGYLLLIAGHFLVTRQRTSGFILRILGGVIWMILGGFMNMSSIIVGSAIFSAIDLYGFYRWTNAN